MATRQTKAAEKNDNPYRAGGSYHMVVETLKRLGLGKMHQQAKVLSTFRDVVGKTWWAEFKAVKPRNKETGKGPERLLLFLESRGGSPERLGLPGDLGGERVRKLS